MKKGWEISEFENCLENVTYTNKIQRKDFKKQGKYPIISQEQEFINGYWDNDKDLFKIKKPVIIFGDHTQVIKFIDFNFVLGADGVKILKAKNHIDPKYLYYYMQNINLENLGYARHYRLLKEKRVAYPKSLSKQRYIVATLDKCFAAIDKAKANAEQNLKNAKELFESYMQGVFGEEPHTKTPRREGWEMKKLGDICEIVGGGTPSKKNLKFYEGNIHWATVRDMKSEIITDTEFKITDDAIKNSSTKIIPKKNVIIATRVGLGKVCLIQNDTAINQDLRGVIPKKLSQLDPYYLFHWFKSISNLIIAEGKGATVQGVTLPFIKNLGIPLPPLKEQQAIVRQLDALRVETQKLEAVYQKKLADLEELKKSILQKAFVGELVGKGVG